MSLKTTAALLLVGSLAACSQQAPDSEATATARTTVVAPGMAVETTGTNGSVVTTNDDEMVAINGNKATQSRALTGQTVQIAGDDNRANYTGQGKECYIIGNGNQVSIENVQLIQVTGTNNQVKWRGAAPKIYNNGEGNVISQVQ